MYLLNKVSKLTHFLEKENVKKKRMNKILKAQSKEIKNLESDMSQKMQKIKDFKFEEQAEILNSVIENMEKENYCHI